MHRVTMFAKGNLDLRDTLHSLRVGSKVFWNGINELVRTRFPGAIVRLRHEISTRSDALLQSNGTVPAAIAERRLPLGPYGSAAQFSAALFETDCNVVVLSILPDLANSLVRHRRDGYLFYPSNWKAWSEADVAWLRNEFVGVDVLDVENSIENFSRIVARLRERSRAPVLIYNVSAVVPGDSVHCYEGLGETFANRIRKFNLGLVELSKKTGISIVDVDTLLARAGADRLKLDTVHLNSEGCRLVAEEVVRILDDLGCFSFAEAQQCS